MGNASKSSVTFSTRVFESSHGTTPRGYGSWAFGFGIDNNADSLLFWFAPPSTFAKAKAAARVEAARRGFSGVITVAS